MARCQFRLQLSVVWLANGSKKITLISETNDLAINGVENFAAAQSSFDMYSFGLDFHEPSNRPPGFIDTCNAPCFDTIFEVVLYLGAAQVDVFSFNRPNGSLEFVGVHSSEAFDRVTAGSRHAGELSQTVFAGDRGVVRDNRTRITASASLNRLLFYFNYGGVR